jgi:AcrR family transcriptional regulator
MESKQSNSEQAILAAAEKIFVQKGFTATRTTDIAAAAGVNHALLHYYFRTKEALFERIFQEKAAQLLDAFIRSFDSDLPFFEKLKLGMERHFDFIAQDPGLPFFILRELIQNEDRNDFIRGKLVPLALEIMKRIVDAVQKEVEQKTIRPIDPQDLLLNIVSLNVFSFISLQLLFDRNDPYPSPAVARFLAQRKKNNVDTIINSIKIEA